MKQHINITEEPKTKCSELDFEHSWKNTTPPQVMLSNPPQYPDKQETCDNCGLQKIYKLEVKKWFEYKI